MKKNKNDNKELTASREEIGKFIKELREERKLTQDDLAEQIHYTRYVISRIERGEATPNYDKLQVLADFFGISVYEIYAAKRMPEEELKNITEVVDNITESIDTKYQHKLKMTLCISIVSILIILFTFLAYYFFNSYNSVKVYKVYGENDQIKTNSGLLILTKDNLYFNLSVSSNEGNFFDKVSLRYKNGKEDNLVYSSSSTDIFLVDFFGYEAYFNYDNIVKEKGTIYIEVECDGIKETLNLNMDKMYENKKFFFKKVQKITSGEKSTFKEIPVPEKIENDFTKDDDEKYYLTLNEQEYIITMSYDSELKQFIVGEDNKKTKDSKLWIYYSEQKVLDYTETENSKITKELSIDIKNMTNDEKEIYQYLEEHYIKKYLE